MSNDVVGREFPIEFSQTIGAIAGALAKAQAKLEDAKKDAVNPHFKNRYATLSSVRAAITPAFSESNLSVVQYFEPHGGEGVCIVTLLMHSSGEWIKSKLYVPVTKKDAQGFGSAISYGRRYALAAIANIASDDDDDGEGSKGSTKVTGKEEAKAPAPAATDIDVDSLVKALENAKTAEDLAKASVHVARVKAKLAPTDIERCRTAHDNKMRELEKAA